MSIVIGSRLGVYEIVGSLGAGGMGEVYRARDSRLNRDVALKVLPDAFARDPDRLARFTREAQTLAALNHPNIAHIHGLEELSGVRALAMELVEGDDLSAIIARGPIPLAEALPIATHIAHALEAAHERGIVHRDLKPANIKVRADGTVKVLDFGLAKALEPVQTESDILQSPTVTSPAMTEAGVVLGTAAYMSPEQARGKPVDRRADIWAFGCVFYEMLTGRRPFVGSDVSEVFASVLAREPDLKALPPSTPASIRRLLRRCLAKDPNARLRDVGDARLELAEAIAGTETVPVLPVAARRDLTRERLLWLSIVAAAMLAAFVLSRRPAPVDTELYVDVATPPSASPLSNAISPDGRTIAYVASSGEESVLWLRSLDSAASRVVNGTARAVAPFWSPDSRSIGFFADGQLKRVDVDGALPEPVTNVRAGVGGTWNPDGVILFASRGNPITRVSAKGGETTPLPRLRRLGNDFAPYFLPDGHRFLYYIRGNPGVRGTYVADLDERIESRRLIDSDTGAVYAASGHLLFPRDGLLYAQAFDLATMKVSGSAVQIAHDVASAATERGISISRGGSIAYRLRSAVGLRQFAWYDRAGKELGRVGEPSDVLSQPSLSRDDRWVAFYRAVSGNVDIWIQETNRGAPRPLTPDPADDVFPVWSPDGGSVVFSSNRTGVQDLYRKTLASGASEELLLTTPRTKLASDWSRDGRFLLFTVQDPKTQGDIWALPLEPKGKPFPVAETSADEEMAQLSPDARWVAYQSNESGRPEIYVQAFPGPGNKWSVSTGGGMQVRWGPNGDELIYVAPNGALMSARFRAAAATSSPEIGAPVKLFAPPIGGAVQQGDDRHQYMISSDGRRFLVAAVKEDAQAAVRLILNWRPR